MHIDYSKSQLIRGLAILGMIWLHCFNLDPYGSGYHDIITVWGGYKLAYILTKIGGICVPLYCFLSGYGLACKYPYEKTYIRKKALRLYEQYWFVLFLFTAIGFVIGAMRYHWDLEEIAGNFIGFHTSWNPTLWFLFPYVLLFAVSKPIIMASRKNWVLTLGVAFVSFVGVMYLLKQDKNGALHLNVLVRAVLEVFHLLPAFLFGVIAKQKESFETSKYNKKKILLSLSLFGVLTACFVWREFMSLIYGICAVYLICNIHWNEQISSVLKWFGKKNVWLWFCHAYFTYSYLHFMTAWAKWPVCIYMVTVGLSLLTALLMEYLFNLIAKRV